MAKLTGKKRLFAHEYLVDLNGTQAAIRAGYAPTRARQTASELLDPKKNPEVVALIAQLQEQRLSLVDLSAESVLRDLNEYLKADLKQVYDERNCIKPIHEWPTFFSRLGVLSVESKELFETIDKKKELVGYITKVKWETRAKILELVGKHVNVNAFRDADKDDVAAPLIELYTQLTGRSFKPVEEAPGLAKIIPPGIAQKKTAAPMSIRPKED